MDSILPRLEKWLAAQSDVRIAILFGSFAESRARPESDVDVAIHCGWKLLPERKVELSQSLAKAVNREVDWVDLADAHGLVLKDALTRGKVLKNTDPDLWRKLATRFIFEEADFGPLRNRALKERRMRVFKTRA